ncbi:MAG: DUF2071 domain-containing protein [Chloroflexi bacterium]|nr:DUF2071 domain-containing protein [Chloroflexota bacterium]
MPDYDHILRGRLATQRNGRLDVRSGLHHFALINYALPKARLEPHLPTNRFEIPEFDINGRPLALMSAVPFVDVDFHFRRLFPFAKFRFGQTNYRVYVFDKERQEHCVWFFGTTLGSAVVYLARGAWRIPWHYARYQINCHYDQPAGRYTTYQYSVRSPWGAAEIDLEDTGEAIKQDSAAGFTSFAEMQLILTHPVDGFFYRLDGQVGSYSVWHETIPMTVGKARNLYFGLYERLGLLSREEMQRPHSVFLCPATEFVVFLPPKITR